jgi:hypothetical protein
LISKLFTPITKAIRQPETIVPQATREWLYRSKTCKLVVERLKFYRSEVCLISFPRSGRTWLRVILAKAIHDHYQLDDPSAVYLTHQLTRRVGLPGVYITHDGSASEPWNIHKGGYVSGYSLLTKRYDPRRYASKRVLFLARDIRDLVVSYYHYRSKRTGLFEGSLSDFIRTDVYGVPLIIRFYKSWYENQATPRDFLLILSQSGIEG